MKFTCVTKDLSRALSMASVAALKSSVQPILKQALISVKGEKVLIAGTDCQGFASGLIDVTAPADGDVLVPAERFFSVVSAIDSETVSCEVKKNRFEVKSDDGTYRLATEGASSFPAIPTFTEADVILDSTKMASMIQKTLFSASVNKSRQAISGIQVKLENGTLMMVATDTRRMSICLHPVGEKDKGFEGIIPCKWASNITKALSVGQALMSMDEHRVIVRCGNITIGSSLVAGNFPECISKIPKNEMKIPVARDALLSSLKKAATLCDRDSKIVSIDISDDTITIRAKESEVGDAEVQMPIEACGHKISIKIDPQFLFDVLQHVDAEKVVLECQTFDKPIIIREGRESIFAIMPVI